jgi:hypothetical protein
MAVAGEGLLRKRTLRVKSTQGFSWIATFVRTGNFDDPLRTQAC